VLQDGQPPRPFGDFLKATKKARGVNVTHLAKAAGLSRANYYHLEGDRQAPSIPTAVAILSALGMETRIPSEDDPDLDKDLDIVDGNDTYQLRINWSVEDRLRWRARMGAAGWGTAATAVVALIPGALPVAAAAAAAGASAVAAWYLRERADEKRAARTARASRPQSTRSAPREPAAGRGDVANAEQVREDFRKTAESMSTEDLEALLEAMRAMRAQRDESPPDFTS
jgi:transcriptional regulator with XRE-family HTH domain